MSDSDILISDVTFHPYGNRESQPMNNRWPDPEEWYYPNGYRSNLLGRPKLNAMYQKILNLPVDFGFTDGELVLTVGRHGASGYIPKVHKRIVFALKGPDSILGDDNDRGYLYILTDAREMEQIKQVVEAGDLKTYSGGGGGKKRKSKRKKRKSHKRKSHKRKSHKRKSRRIRRR